MSFTVQAQSTPFAVKTVVRRYAPVIILCALILILLGQFTTTFRSSLILIGYPFGVDYGEGIVWQQMINIVHGKGYAPLGVYPAIVYHYPPIYHLVTAAFSQISGLDGLAAGRWISWLATLGTAALIGRLAWIGLPDSGRAPQATTALLSALMFLGCDPVIEWCATMRVDMLAAFFGMAGMVVAVQSVRRPALIYPAALLFVAAIFTKQVSIAAPAAVWVALLLVSPKQAWRLAIATILFGSAALLAACWFTHGEFIRHIFSYNINRFRPDLIKALRDPLEAHAIYIVLAAAGGWHLQRRFRRSVVGITEPMQLVAGATILVFLLLKTFMLGMMMKSGASSNYLVEWCAALALAASLALHPGIQAAFDTAKGKDTRLSTLFVCCLLSVVAMQAVNLSRDAIVQTDTVSPAHTMWRLVKIIQKSRGPVISDEMTLLVRAGRPVQFEPAIVAELGAQGRYNQVAFVKLIQHRSFGLFITAGGPGNPVFDSRYNTPVIRAIQANYPLTQDVDGFVIRRPASDG